MLFDKIKESYENNKCYQDEKLCGPNRVRLNGDFFPSPYPYVGENYEFPTIRNKPVPKIFFISVNQNLSDKNLLRFKKKYSDEKERMKRARMSLYPINIKDLEEHEYGPLELCVYLANIAFSMSLQKNEYIPNEEIMKNIAYSNCVRCANKKVLRAAPTKEMLENCEELTRFEIDTLQPDMIFCIGKKPFEQIANMCNKKIYERKDLVSDDLMKDLNTDNLIKDFIFLIKSDTKTISVIYFYHYGFQQSVNTGSKMIQLFSIKEFINDENAKKIIADVKKEIKKWEKVWRKASYTYNAFAKYYAIKIIEYAIKEYSNKER
jgi:hypothetical protein